MMERSLKSSVLTKMTFVHYKVFADVIILCVAYIRQFPISALGILLCLFRCLLK